MTSIPAQPAFSTRDRWFLGALLLLGLLVGASGIVHHGYIGQDFDGLQGHNHLVRNYPDYYSYKLTNPPGLYVLGHFIFQRFTTVYYLEIIASLFLVANLAAVALIFGLIWRMIESRPLRYAAAALVMFLPFRTVHAIVLASDAFTLPFFAVAAVLALRIFENPRRYLAWLGLTVCLTTSLYCKYTFIGLLPPLAVLFAVIVLRAEKTLRLRLVGLAVLALALPAALFTYELGESAKVHGANTEGHWRAKGAPPVMRWSDILTLQKSDWEIFSAPQYFRDQVYGFRKYSYPALVHLASFSDLQNFFQSPPKNLSETWRHRLHNGFMRDRSAASDRLEKWALMWSVPYSVLAVLGTLACAVLSAQSVLVRKSPWADPATMVVTMLALGFYSPIFLNLQRVGDPYTAGYWLPRLVLPALVMFFVFGFVLVDRLGRIRPESRTMKIVSGALLGHVLVACVLFIGFLF